MARLGVTTAQIYVLRRIDGGEYAQASPKAKGSTHVNGRWNDRGLSCPSINPLLRRGYLRFAAGGWPEYEQGTYYKVVLSEKGKQFLNQLESEA